MQSQDLVLLVRPPAPSQPACGAGGRHCPRRARGVLGCARPCLWSLLFSRKLMTAFLGAEKQDICVCVCVYLS